MKIPYAKKIFDKNEYKNIEQVLKENVLTHSRFCNQFERDFSKYLNAKHCLLVNSGSSANLTAFMCLTQKDLGKRQIKRGDEVITTSCCFPTTLSPIIQYGANPVFVDVTIPEYNIDVTKLKKALSKKTKAVMIAHTLGNPFNIEVVSKFCKDNNLWLISDECDATGAKYNDKYLNYYADISTFSFYPAHILCGVEAGAVVTNNEELYLIMKSLRDWGKQTPCNPCISNCNKRFYNDINYDHKYTYDRFGYNLKATEFQGAILVEQLKKLDQFLDDRKANWEYLKEKLKVLEDKIILPDYKYNTEPSWFGFCITSKEKLNIEVQEKLESKGIETRPLFSGDIEKQPCFKHIEKYRIVDNLDNTEEIMDYTYWIGVHPYLIKENLNYIIYSLKEIYRV